MKDGLTYRRGSGGLVKAAGGLLRRFVRVKVNIKSNAKIKRFVTGKKGDETVRYQVKYEKILTFCFNCGEFGRWYEECGDGEHDESTIEWGGICAS